MMSFNLRVLILLTTLIVALNVDSASGRSRPATEDDFRNSTWQKSWPEVLGRNGQEAKDYIQADNPNLEVYIQLTGTSVTYDIQTNRVIIFVNEEGIVDQIPFVG